MKNHDSERDIEILSAFQESAGEQLKTFQNTWNNFELKSWGAFRHSRVCYLLFALLLSVYLGLASPSKQFANIFSIHWIQNLDFPLLNISILIFSFTIIMYLVRLLVCTAISKQQLFQWPSTNYMIFEGIFFFFLILSLWAVSYNLGVNFFDSIKIIVSGSVLTGFTVFNMYHLRLRYRYIHRHISKYEFQKEITKFVSIRQKNLYLVLTLIIIVAVVMLLINIKNFSLILSSVSRRNIINIPLSTFNNLRENAFVLGILILSVGISTLIYSTNTRLMFILMNHTIFNILNKKYNDVYFPIANDEFGVLSENINLMSKEEQEKERIRSVFGKHMPEKIATAILEHGTPLTRGGNVRDIVVMHTDIRNIQKFMKEHVAKEVILFLNKYFTDMERIIERYDGIVDKYVGSSFTALYGINEKRKGINNAVYAACHIQDHLLKIKSKFKSCIGIGLGETLLGLMGSANHLEFTALGNNVESAKRLKEITYKIDVDIMIDSTMYKNLYLDLKGLPWKKFRIHLNNDNSLYIYGLKIKQKNNIL